MSSNKGWHDIDVTRDELERVATALKDEEFKKMFFEYCAELQDPENQKKYQEEITQLEAERGVDITFLHPEPGFVVKSSADGEMKAFINIAKSDKIDRPKSEVMQNPENGKPGLNWSIPLAQAPPRRDADNKGNECMVYDVLFHPEALHLSEKNSAFRKHLVDTACDAVEREFHVKLDRTNLKFPKLKFKGVARPIVTRKRSNNPPTDMEPSPIDSMYPPLPKEGEENKPKVFTSGTFKKPDEYAIPRYIIKHRRGLDMSEMTYELDAKLNITVPKELVVEIELPLLKSTANCTLDVTERRLFLVSEKPAKYKLCIDLPFPVNDKEGSAKFDQATRKLTVVLPVCPEKERKMKDLYREDSGVESDVKDENGCISSSNVEGPLIQILSSKDSQQFDEDIRNESSEQTGTCEKFLKNSIKYNFPHNFDCNTLDENLAFTLHVKNADPQSLEYVKGPKFVHLKFSSIGSGYYPVHYAFYVTFPEDCETAISSVEAEAWDNNVILNLALKGYENLKTYSAGLDVDDLMEYQITEQFFVPSKKFLQVQEKDIEISVKPSEDQVQIDIKPVAVKDIPQTKEDNEKAKDSKKSSTSKKQKKKNKKRRSLSESSCDDLKCNTNLDKNSNSNDGRQTTNDNNLLSGRKIRSVSESRDHDNNDIEHSPKDFKGILKHRSRYGRSISESCSSIDDLPAFSSSIDLPLADSISDIPEEGGSPQLGLSESCKKTVRFSDVIRKQLFRLDSSILGQRKKNQKRKSQKQRALQRRNSEGDSSDYFDKSGRSQPLMHRKNRKLSQHDSGLDLSEDDRKESKKGCTRERMESESSDFDSKNALMFDMEM